MDKEEYIKKKQAEIDKLLEDIEKGVKDVFKSDKFKEFLDTMSKFRSYSVSNCVLIQMQRPDATLIAGYKKWQKENPQLTSWNYGLSISWDNNPEKDSSIEYYI